MKKIENEEMLRLMETSYLSHLEESNKIVLENMEKCIDSQKEFETYSRFYLLLSTLTSKVRKFVYNLPEEECDD